MVWRHRRGYGPSERDFLQAVLFGSSFNVVDQHAALHEVCRLLVPDGWFACMWNHRDLDDPVQLKIESIIKAAIPGYSYGSRREDPRGVIDASGYFLAAQALERSFSWRTRPADIVEAVALACHAQAPGAQRGQLSQNH